MSAPTDTLKNRPWEDLPTDTSTRDLFDKDKGLPRSLSARELVDAVLGRTIQTGTRFPPDTLAARVEAVLAMHHPSHDRDGKPVGVCADCGWSVPCPTVRALNGKP